MPPDNLTDRAVTQSVEDRIAEKFGLPGQSEPEGETAAPVASVEADLFELDWEGEKFTIPAKLKDGFMKNQDYTQKTQALAEQRAALDQVRELASTSQMKAAFEESVSAERQQLNVIDAYLQQAKALDWANMSTDQMVRQGRDLDNVKEQRAELVKQIGEKRTAFDIEIKSKISELRGKSRDLASKSIQGFTEAAEKEVRAYALSQGLSDTEVDNVLLDPRSYKIMYHALQFTKVQSGTNKAVQTAEKLVKPGAASARPLAGAAEKSHFQKAMHQAPTSRDKATLIEERLAGMFATKR